MQRSRLPKLIPLVALAVSVTACDPCAGTPSCHSFPEVSYTGEFIERYSGMPVEGVRVRFARLGGVRLLSDTLEAVSDARGFFTLRGGAHESGTVIGRLLVTPPAPFSEYAIPSVVLSTTTTRGSGGVLPRLVANPYVQLIVTVRDRATGAPIPNAAVEVQQVGTARINASSNTGTSADNGRLLWEGLVTTYGILELDFAVTVPGQAAPYHLHHQVAPQYQDEPPRFLDLLIGRRLTYRGDVARRGTGERFPGVVLEFVRRSGVMIEPDSFRIDVPADGVFTIDPFPYADGEVVGELRVIPPAPFPTESFPNTRLIATSQDEVRYLGFLGYGTSVFTRPVLVYRASGQPVEAGVHARYTRTGGLPFVYPPGTNPAADSGIRIIEADGGAPFTAGTADTGFVDFDIEVRLHPPHAWEQIRGVRARARYDSVPSVRDTIGVGIWYPWVAEVRDAVTDQPLEGIRAEFHLTPPPLRRDDRTFIYRVASGPDGRFPVRPRPLADTGIVGFLHIQGGATHRDTVIADLRILPFQDDTIRVLGVYRLNRR